MARQWTIDDHKPRNQSHKEQDLPKSPQFEKLPALMAYPEPPVAQKSLDPGNFSKKASSCHDQNGNKQDLNEVRLSLGLNTSDNRTSFRSCLMPFWSWQKEAFL